MLFKWKILYHCIYAQQMKLRRSFIWLICLTMPAISSIMGCANYTNNLDLLSDGWLSLWTQTTLFYSLFFFSPMIAVYCAYLWRLENFNHNRNTLFSVPVPVAELYLSQFAYTGFVTLLTQLISFFLYIICGKLTGLNGIPPAETFIWMLQGFVGGLAITSLQLLLGAVLKSFALPIGIAILGSFAGLLFSNKGWGLYFPYSLMIVGMNSNRSEDVLSDSRFPFFISCILFCLLFLYSGIVILKKKDVKA